MTDRELKLKTREKWSDIIYRIMEIQSRAHGVCGYCTLYLKDIDDSCRDCPLYPWTCSRWITDAVFHKFIQTSRELKKLATEIIVAIDKDIKNDIKSKDEIRK